MMMMTQDGSGRQPPTKSDASPPEEAALRRVRRSHVASEELGHDDGDEDGDGDEDDDASTPTGRRLLRQQEEILRRMSSIEDELAQLRRLLLSRYSSSGGDSGVSTPTSARLPLHECSVAAAAGPNRKPGQRGRSWTTAVAPASTRQSTATGSGRGADGGISSKRRLAACGDLVVGSVRGGSFVSGLQPMPVDACEATLSAMPDRGNDAATTHRDADGDPTGGETSHHHHTSAETMTWWSSGPSRPKRIRTTARKPGTQRRDRTLDDGGSSDDNDDIAVETGLYGINALPPEIWTHILRFVASSTCPVQRPSSHPPVDCMETCGSSPEQQGNGNGDEDAEQDDGDNGNEDADQDGKDGQLYDLDNFFMIGEQLPTVTQNAFSGPLGTAMLVCTTWRRLALSVITQYRLDPLKHKQHIHRCLVFLSANCNNLKYLNLSDCRVVDSMLCHLPQGLKYLYLCRTMITDAGISYLPLSITHLYLNDVNITNAGLDDIPPLIEELSLDNTFVNLGDSTFNSFPSLRSLSLSASEDVTDNGINSLPRQLTQLQLSSSGSLDDYHQFGDDAFFNFGSRYRKLTFLRLDDVDISSEGMRELHQCATIKQLYLAYCSYITDSDFAFVPPYLSILGLNHLSHVCGEGLSFLPESLEILYLQQMHHMPVETIAGNIPKKLKTMVIEASLSGWTEALRKLVPSASSVSNPY